MMYQRIFDQIALGKPDDQVLRGAFAAMSEAIVGSRKRLEQHWRKVVDADLKFKLVWKRRDKIAKSAKHNA
jgi:hypothetical protein